MNDSISELKAKLTLATDEKAYSKIAEQIAKLEMAEQLAVNRAAAEKRAEAAAILVEKRGEYDTLLAQAGELSGSLPAQYDRLFLSLKAYVLTGLEILDTQAKAGELLKAAEQLSRVNNFPIPDKFSPGMFGQLLAGGDPTGELAAWLTRAAAHIRGLEARNHGKRFDLSFLLEHNEVFY